MFGLNDETLNSVQNYQITLSNSNSIANEHSKVYSLGDSFTSEMTGFKMTIDMGYVNEKEEHLEYLLNFRV